MTKTVNMTQGKPIKLLFAFALPLMFGNIFQQLYTVVDTAIVGQGVGLSALAALGAVDWFNWMMLGIAQGYSQGFCVRISQKFGEGDMDGVKKVIGQSAALSVMIAVCWTIIGQAGLPLLLKLLRVQEELIPLSGLYTRIMIGGFSATMFYNFCSAVLRAVGDSKTPLKAMVAASVINIILDSIAVFVLGWGIGGAAAATVFSQCLAGAFCAVKMNKTSELRFHKEHIGKDRSMKQELMGLGTPIALKNIVVAVGGMTVQSVVNGFAMSFIAGFTATNKLYGLLEIAAISYGYAVTTYVGQNYGAARLDRIKEGMRSAIVLSVLTSILIGGLMLFFGREITMLFISSDNPELLAVAGNTAYTYLSVMSICLPILYLLYVYLSALQGMGNTIGPLVSGIIEFVIRVGISFFVGYSGFQSGIFGAEVAAWIGSTVYLMISYYRNIGKEK
ncbi:MAG: MATE family efflux transporter [Lachnospiraceae bacterium]|nr:MATE family efflux transporter [Lachnospiraceae bacterium]